MDSACSELAYVGACDESSSAQNNGSVSMMYPTVCIFLKSFNFFLGRVLDRTLSHFDLGSVCDSFEVGLK